MSEYLIFGAILFAIGAAGVVINRKNLIVVFMSTELMLLGVNTNFVAFSHHFADVQGQIMVFFVLTVAAAEAAIGLALLVLYFRAKDNIDVDTMAKLKG